MITEDATHVFLGFEENLDISFFEKYGWVPWDFIEAEYFGEKVMLNKPYKTPHGNRKFTVFLKDKNRIKKINFGDSNMNIIKHTPKFLKNKSFWTCK